MINRSIQQLVVQAAIAIIGTGAAFAFLDAGAFRAMSAATLQRMLTPSALRAAALGAGVTALLLLPVLIWQIRRVRRGGNNRLS